mgnify:FL=1
MVSFFFLCLKKKAYEQQMLGTILVISSAYANKCIITTVLNTRNLLNETGFKRK